MPLQAQLDALSPELRVRLEERGFDAARLVTLASEMHRGSRSRNVLTGELSAVPLESMAKLPEPDTEEYKWLCRLGEEAIERGELAVCVLAGGMATRMGGVVKALVELAPGFTFLDVELGERRRLREELGRAPELWLMTSEATDRPIREALAQRGAPKGVATFEQQLSLRLTEDGELFLGDDGEPSTHATGHGDLPDALRASGLLDDFLARRGRYVWISNLDNIGARIEPAILGQHIEGSAALTVEVVDRHEGDVGGGPVNWNGRPIIVEHLRLPPAFDAGAVPLFNTNTFLVDAPALASIELDWTYLEIRKNVKGADGDRVAIQLERLLGELTTALPSRLLHVSREAERSRFLAFKTLADLERQQEAITRIVERTRLLAP